MANLSEALVAYKICAQAEAKAQRTVNWVVDIVGYFKDFVGDISIEAITADDLRRFIVALQQRQAFSNHCYTKTQNRTLSPQSIASYVRAIKTFFSYLEHEKLITHNLIKKVKLPKTPKTIMSVFNEKAIQKLLARPKMTYPRPLGATRTASGFSEKHWRLRGLMSSFAVLQHWLKLYSF